MRFVKGDLTYNNLTRAVRALKSLDVIMERKFEGGDCLELHPLVRSFIRSTFTLDERKPFITSIIGACDQMIKKVFPRLKVKPKEITRFWISKIELCIETQDYLGAVVALDQVSEALLEAEQTEEMVRLGELFISKFGYSSTDEAESIRDRVFRNLIEQLAQLGRVRQFEGHLEAFKETLDGKSVRFIFYCDLAARAYWLVGNYSKGVELAEEGVELKESKQADTDFESKHVLARCLRESGETERAIEIFRGGVSLDDIFEEEHEGSSDFFGNIGRALQLQGDFERARILLRRSARLLISEHGNLAQVNRGWAAFWLTDVLVEEKSFEMAICAAASAGHYWRDCYVLKSRESLVRSANLRPDLEEACDLPSRDKELVAIYESWLLSRGKGSSSSGSAV